MLIMDHDRQLTFNVLFWFLANVRNVFCRGLLYILVLYIRFKTYIKGFDLNILLVFAHMPSRTKTFYFLHHNEYAHLLDEVVFITLITYY